MNVYGCHPLPNPYGTVRMGIRTGWGPDLVAPQGHGWPVGYSLLDCYGRPGSWSRSVLTAGQLDALVKARRADATRGDTEPVA